MELILVVWFVFNSYCLGMCLIIAVLCLACDALPIFLVCFSNRGVIVASLADIILYIYIYDIDPFLFQGFSETFSGNNKLNER